MQLALLIDSRMACTTLVLIVASHLAMIFIAAGLRDL